MASPAYSIGNTRQWDGNVVSNPTVKTTWDQGYGVIAPMQKHSDKNRDARNDLYHLANGQLNNGTWQWPLFITAVDIDFSVSGSMAQSRLTRDFYPHNFIQPVFSITGQALDEMDYGAMCDFVHMCQHTLLNNFNENSLLQLQVAHRGIPGGRNQGLTVSYTDTNGSKTVLHNQSIHGPHSEIIAKGVVLSMPRQHETGVPSQNWTFQFQVYQMLQGPFEEGRAGGPSGQKTWVDMLKATAKDAVTTSQALIKQNDKVLKWAGQNSVNVISSSDDGYTGQSGGGSGGGGAANTSGGGTVTSHLLNQNQRTFASVVSQQTGLDPIVVAAWVLSEEPASSSQAPNGANNWLNIGSTDSGFLGGGGSIWTDPSTAGQASADWLKGQNSVPGYGTASPGIQAITRTAGKGAQAQIQAIQQSGWASSGYPNLPTVYNQVKAAS